MMRTKAFDPDATLDRAMEFFWAHGYAAAGVDELLRHLGLSRSSLYATYGSKEELFRRALERYLEREARPALAALAEPGPVLPVLRRMLLRLADVERHDPERRGCMVVNTAMERIPADDASAATIRAHLAADVDVLAAALRRAQAQGEVGDDRDPVALARFLVTLIQGLRVVGKATADLDALRDTVDVALAAVGGEPPGAQGAVAAGS